MASRVAYITSMKRGLASFIHRELCEVVGAGIEVLLFATKLGPGLYMPKPEWPIKRLRPSLVLLSQPLFFASNPRKYLELLRIAVRTNSLVDFLIAFDFASTMQSYRVTSIHCKEGLHSLSIGYYCKRLLGLPLTVTIYADALYTTPSPRLLRMALPSCDAVVTICEHNRDLLVSQYGVPPQRVRVIPVFVDTNRFAPTGHTTVLIVGQYAERKGHEVLFEAIRRLNRGDIVVWVVGGRLSGQGDDYVDVPKIARDLAIEDRTVFFGNVSEDVLRSLYSSCDIFCLPSRFRTVSEGTPVALMEAMACERPVVTTRHAGIPEYVEEVLVEEDDVDGLARAIAYLADHPEVRSAQGKRNRDIIQRKFSGKNIEALITVLREAEGATRGLVPDTEMKGR